MVEITEYETVKRWINAVRADKTGSDYTEKRYLQILTDFCEWAGKNPDELIAKRKEDLKNEEEADKRKVEEQVREYCIFLEKERGWKRGTSALYHAGIRSFYKYNYVPLQMPSPKRGAIIGVAPHTPEEIKELLRHVDVRGRFIVLGLLESGMSREDFVSLTYGVIKKEYEAGKQFVHMKVIRKKEQVAYETFLGVNAISALKSYLEYRKRRGENIAEQTFLIVTERGQKRALTPEALSQLFVKLGQKAGFKSSPHRLRKFFESYVGLVVPSLLVRYWMGHSLHVEKSYFRPPIEEQRKKYMEAYKKIDVYGKPEKSEEERRKQTIIDMVRLQYKDDPETQALKVAETKNILKKAKTMREIDSVLEEATENENEDCQKIVSEDELPKYLDEGWHVSAVLPSGKIVVESNNNH